MFTAEIVAFAALIFVLRVVNTAVGTVRLVVVTRQQRWLASALAFLEALIFAVVMANVVNDLTNILNLLAYCGGFAAGSWVGMAIETRFITSYMTVNVVTATRGHEIALALREHGYGVTETLGEGRDGTVAMLRSVVINRDVPKVLDIIRGVQSDVFVAVEEARAVHRGWIRASRIQPS